MALIASRRGLVLVLAMALDASVGELPNELHPVAWIGAILGALSRRAPRRPARRALLAGGAIECVTVGTAFAAGLAVNRFVQGLPLPWSALIEAYFLKQALALRALLDAADAVRGRLDADDVPGAKAALLSLVSRDRDLPVPLIAAAAIESVAENCCDSVIAPLIAYALGGLPAAYAYRAANTADAMLGYRDDREYLGKVAARLDDLANLVPARFTALALVAAAPSINGSARDAWRAMRRDHRLTASPNAGWTMSAAAGGLGIALEKLGAYRLNDGARVPTSADIGRALRMARRACLGAAALLASVYTVSEWLHDRRSAAPCPTLPARAA